jgi:hypothetical protein
MTKVRRCVGQTYRAQAALLTCFSSPDFRYMATNDLLTELQKDSFKLDADGEKRVCQARSRCGGSLSTSTLTEMSPLCCTHGSQVVLKQLEDTSPEVQALAVKWCASAVRCEDQR